VWRSGDAVELDSHEEGVGPGPGRIGELAYPSEPARDVELLTVRLTFQEDGGGALLSKVSQRLGNESPTDAGAL
jgi:hypothetical protein